MKRYRRTGMVLIMLAMMAGMAGCGGGGGSSAAGGGSAVSLFPEVDELEALRGTPASTVRTVSNRAVIRTVPTKGPKTELPLSAGVGSLADGTGLLFRADADINASAVGKPLFVGGVFRGIVTGVKAEGNVLVVRLEDADRLEDVYSSFDVEFRNDAVRRAVQRSIDGGGIRGRYDSLNAKPLQISVVEKPVTNARGLTNDEIVLRIDIPKGYHIPVEPRAVECSFTDLECSLTVDAAMSKKIDLKYEHTVYGITFSTEGSYIEIGLGAYLRAHYDHNLASRDVLDFDLAQSAYFRSNMTVSVSGELKRNWSTTINLLGSINVEIVHPYSAVAKTTVLVVPNIVLGVDGKVSGKIAASSYVERGGEVRFRFDSRDLSHDISHSLKYTPQNLNRDSVTLDIEADGNAYIFPAITTLPSLRFARIGPSITLAFMRSGVKLNTNIHGKINTGFVVENEKQTRNTSTEASLTTSLEGLVQGRWYVRIAAFDATKEKAYAIDFYHQKEYGTIFSTGQLKVLEWKAMLLENPKIKVEEDVTDYNKRRVSFDLDIDGKILPKIYFYYSTDGKDIPVKNIWKHRPVWRPGDAPVSVDKNSRIKVRAVLYNKSVSTSLWAWGTSVSAQEEKLLTELNAPTVFPPGTGFVDSVTVTMTQDQGFDIYYRKNGDAALRYTGPIELGEDTTLVVYARTEIDGRKYYSEKRTYKYEKCAENETLEIGNFGSNICVESEPEEPGGGNNGGGGDTTFDATVSIPGYGGLEIGIAQCTFASIDDGPRIYPNCSVSDAKDAGSFSILHNDLLTLIFNTTLRSGATYAFGDDLENWEANLIFTTPRIRDENGIPVTFWSTGGTVTLSRFGVNTGDRISGTFDADVMGRVGEKEVYGRIRGSFSGTLEAFVAR